VPKYRKKPVVVEAWQFTKNNFSNGAPDFIRFASNKPVTLFSQYAGEVIYGEIQTLEGVMRVSEGDYIIKGAQGEFYPCKPDIFEKTYQLENSCNQLIKVNNKLLEIGFFIFGIILGWTLFYCIVSQLI